MHTPCSQFSHELEEVHARHRNHHIFATCKQLAATRPAWLERLLPHSYLFFRGGSEDPTDKGSVDHPVRGVVTGGDA